MEYWFWDDLYTTEKTVKLAAAAFYSGKAFTVPFVCVGQVVTCDVGWFIILVT